MKPEFWLTVAILFSMACKTPPASTSATAIGELEVSDDGTEAWVRLAKGVSVATLIDLEVFGPFDPRVRPTTECPFGESGEKVTRGGEHLCIYDRDGRRVAVVAESEPKSWGEGSVRRYELRALPPDPPYSTMLPGAVREIIRQQPRLRVLALVPGSSAELGIRLDLEAGRVRGVTAVPLVLASESAAGTDRQVPQP